MNESFEKVQSTDSSHFVSIIILNYNAGELILDCIKSIRESTYSNYEIILVDNASKDNSHIICKQNFPEIKLIQNSENLGFCEGNNVGLKIAKGEFIVILNPDTIVEQNWLDELVKAYLKNGDGIYQPKFLALSDHSMLLSTGNMIQIFGFGFSRSKGETDNNKYQRFEKIDYASGTCLFTSKKILDKIGLLDEFLFAFHDDLEFCWRAALIKINSFYVPKSIVYHPVEGTSFRWSPLKFKLLERNRKYCLLTLYDRKTIFKMLPSLILVDIAVFFFYLSKGIVKMKILADLEILKNFSTINKKYSEIQKIKVVTDKEIIYSLKNEIRVPKWVVNDKVNDFFNHFLNSLSKITRWSFKN